MLNREMTCEFYGKTLHVHKLGAYAFQLCQFAPWMNGDLWGLMGIYGDHYMKNQTGHYKMVFYTGGIVTISFYDSLHLALVEQLV